MACLVGQGEKQFLFCWPTNQPAADHSWGTFGNGFAGWQ